MSKLKKQQQEIEEVRKMLHDLVIAKAGNMIDPDVAELSIRLDKLIVAYEKEKKLNQNTK